jgi:hypothetical protein
LQDRFRLEVSRRFLLPIAVTLGLVLVSEASASQLIDRNASGVRLVANSKGEALITYRAHGQSRHVVAWGAVDARQPTSGKPQVRFRWDYSGRGRYWLTFRNQCRRYDGPPLPFLVAACAAPDGSYWALQSWSTPLPDLGMLPWLSVHRARELHLSHWRGPLVKLELGRIGSTARATTTSSVA